MALVDKNILLIIGGGIAAYKALDLIRRLRERGAKLQTIITPAGQRFVTPLTVSALVGAPVHSDLFATDERYDIGHIRLARAADLIVIAPLTASRMAKMVAGIGDDLAGSVLLAASCPILAAPAMNPHMWAHPATRRNLAQLQADGVEFIGPEWGEMAEAGESGLGRMSEVAHIITRIEQFLKSGHRFSDKNCDKTERLEEFVSPPQPKPLSGRHIIVTAGPTHEPIDPVRFLANRSSGKQGYAIAQTLAAIGARVSLISGPVTLPDPAGVEVIRVETAGAMLAAVEAALPAEAAIFVAAVADWRLAAPAAQKMKKQVGQDSLDLKLVKNPDILATIAKSPNRPKLVIGFAAETCDVLAHAQKKLHDKGADWIVANDVSRDSQGASIMGGDKTQVHIVSHQGVTSWPAMSKQEMAGKLAQKIVLELTDK